MKHLFSTLFVLTLVLAGPAAADAVTRSITVNGTGKVEAEPDMAVITLGITEDADAAVAAMARVSEAMGQVLTSLEALGIAAEDMQTDSVALRPLWSNRPSNSGERPEIAGFQAQNDLTLRVRALDQLGRVLDRVLQDGANRFSGLSLTVADPEPLMAEARAAAVADAIAKAEALAQAAGVSLGPVRTITEQGSGMPRPMMMQRAAVQDAAMPVAPGEITLEASVSMVFDIVE